LLANLPSKEKMMRMFSHQQNGDAVAIIINHLTNTCTSRGQSWHHIRNSIKHRSLKIPAVDKNMSQENAKTTKASFLLAALLLSFDKRTEVYHWWAGGNEAMLHSLVRMFIGQYLDVMAHCIFYDKEKGPFFYILLD